MSIPGLLSVFRTARRLIDRPGNDFSWSGWADANEAGREIEAIITVLEKGKLPDRRTMRVLFALTGPLQELGLSSGWAQEFLELAKSFDRESQGLQETSAIDPLRTFGGLTEQGVCGLIASPGRHRPLGWFDWAALPLSAFRRARFGAMLLLGFLRGSARDAPRRGEKHHGSYYA